MAETTAVITEGHSTAEVRFAVRSLGVLAVRAPAADLGAEVLAEGQEEAEVQAGRHLQNIQRLRFSKRLPGYLTGYLN